MSGKAHSPGMSVSPVAVWLLKVRRESHEPRANFSQEVRGL